MSINVKLKQGSVITKSTSPSLNILEAQKRIRELESQLADKKSSEYDHAKALKDMEVLRAKKLGAVKVEAPTTAFNKGGKPFSYSEVNDNVDPKWTNQKPYKIVNEGYYLCLSGGTVYYRNFGPQAQTTILAKLLKNIEESDANTIYNESMVPSDRPRKDWQSDTVNLTNSEFSDILKAKPSKDALFKSYRQVRQNEITLNVSIATPVF